MYFVLEGTQYPYLNGSWGIVDILRDSSGYLVNAKGQVKFAVDNFTDILSSREEIFEGDTLYSVFYIMEKIPGPVTVAAGTFDVLNFKGTVDTPFKYTNVEYPRYLNNYYANEVGKILSTTFFLSSAAKTEKRLLRFRLN
jgi:hypothetical protein